MLAQLSASLLDARVFDPSELLTRALKVHAGQEVEINPHILSYAPRRPSLEARMAILAEATADLPLLPGFVP